MSVADRERWDAKYSAQSAPTELSPPEWLIRHAESLPPGKALDLATGYGHTAIWLAERGWDVTAMDISPVGLESARQLAERQGVIVNWVTADLDNVVLGEQRYDLVTVFRFLDRRQLPGKIIAALRVGGRLLYETFVMTDDARLTSHRNPMFVLNPGELPELFVPLQIEHYEERNLNKERVASLIARKP